MNSAWWLALVTLWSLPFWQISARAAESALTPGPALETAKPLIAWWRFDEADGDPCVDASGNANNASQEGGGGSRFHHIEGLFGSALSFSGQRLLRVPGGPDFGVHSKLSLTAWVRPAGF